MRYLLWFVEQALQKPKKPVTIRRHRLRFRMLNRMHAHLQSNINVIKLIFCFSCTLKNECEGGDIFCVRFFKQNLVWRKYGHDSLNKILKRGWKNECAGPWETDLFGLIFRYICTCTLRNAELFLSNKLFE